MTIVVNIRHDRYDVYIGRPGRGEDGYFGNPFRVGHVCQRCGQFHATAGSTKPCFDAYFNERMWRDTEYYRRVVALKDKKLGCFCKPYSWCHGDTIREWLDSW